MPALRTRDTQSHQLEVTTDAPSPTLAVIAPTPRAFTFPVSHNLDVSPYSTPSNSPFEPDLRYLEIYSPASSCITTPPSCTRTLSPDSCISSVSLPSPPSNRKASSCDAERRPKKGDGDYIKRPENAFILFRRKCCEDRQQAEEEAAPHGPTKKQRQADLSKTISQQWKGLSPQDRQYWEDLAKEKKRAHQERYPDYVYRPQRARDKDGRARNKKYGPRGSGAQREPDTDAETTTFVVPPPRPIGRSTSAPTPPPLPYQSIQIPSLYPSPSCPPSPSLLPMISRRAARIGSPEDVMSSFDYHPRNHLVPPSFGQVDYEAGLQSSDLLRTMFNLVGQGPEYNPAAQLQPLALPAAPLFVQQAASPTQSTGSVSSAASSPTSGPFTPNSALRQAPLTLVNADPVDTCSPDQQAPPELDIQMGTQMTHDTSYSASYPWNPNAIWQTEPSMLMGRDFDLSGIPSIELGMPRTSEDAPVFGLGCSSDAGLAVFAQDYPQEFLPGYEHEFMNLANDPFDLKGDMPSFDGSG